MGWIISNKLIALLIGTFAGMLGACEAQAVKHWL